MSLFPLIRFDPIDEDQANDALRRWEHRMGPVERPYDSPRVHGLFHAEQLVALTYTSTLIRECVGGGARPLKPLELPGAFKALRGSIRSLPSGSAAVARVCLSRSRCSHRD